MTPIAAKKYPNSCGWLRAVNMFGGLLPLLVTTVGTTPNRRLEAPGASAK
jgi:hypothetical protein